MCISSLSFFKQALFALPFSVQERIASFPPWEGGKLTSGVVEATGKPHQEVAFHLSQGVFFFPVAFTALLCHSSLYLCFPLSVLSVCS